MKRLVLLLLAFSIDAAADNRYSARLQYSYSLSEAQSNEDTAVLVGDDISSHFLDGRLMLDGGEGDWDWALHYELNGWHSDELEARNILLGEHDISFDRNRLFDLTHTIKTTGSTAIYHQLDRFYIGRTAERYSWKAGRYAVSWGNGLAYHPLDIFNPFRPEEIDTEYKNGDDMITTQWLFDNGSDLQWLWVPRRNIDNEVDKDSSSLAIKLHGMHSQTDYDVLLASHYADTVIGFGFASDIDGVLWRGDVTWTRVSGDADDYLQLVTSVMHSWSWIERPVTGFVEFFYNQQGLAFDDGYAVTDPVNAQALFDRLDRQELFTLARYYLATGLDIELHPLLHFSPNWFVNLDDASSLLQLLVSVDARQDLVLRAGINLSAGRTDSEYGRYRSGFPPTYQRQTLFLQLSAYL